MKLTNSIILLIILLYGISIRAQNINIHSVATLRQTTWDNGYTLDGDHMAPSRAKLYNPANFGDTGVYKKNIIINSAYYTSGSLEQITQIDGIDLFFFGSFGGPPDQFVAFTNAEIDSLYAWSLRGGKMIIAEQRDAGGIYPLPNLDDKWGYNIVWQMTSTIVPVEKAKDTKIFNGPFGVVERANMGGSAQGYFNVNSSDISVLATNAAGKNTLYIDCNTRDLICADIDAYTDLGGLSSGDQILNEQDRFWVNTIAFMDSLGDKPPPAVIQYDGTHLYTDTYYSYQWLFNWDEIDHADTVSILPDADGYYQVIVEDEIGCTDTSNIYVYGSPLLPIMRCPEDISTSTDRGVNFATLTLPLPLAFDSDGIASYANDAPATYPVGVTVVTWTVTDSAGYNSSCSHTVTVNDDEKPTIICPPALTINTDPGVNYANVALDTPDAHDNVFVSSITNNAPEVFQLGTTRIQWMVYDSSGNSNYCMQSVIVTDAEDPQIECPGDISIEVEAGRDNIPIDPGLPVTSDNVRVVSVTNNAPAFFHPGTTVVIWTAMDEAGNMASCDQTVSITTADIPEPETELSFNNIITPNGDGKNEYFIIKDLPENSELIIFDRKDKIRYQDHNYQNDWYGMDSQNIPLEDGTYWFIVITPDGQEHSGYVIVKRQ